MSDKSQNEEFEDFSVERLLDNTKTDFELFLCIDDHIIQYAGNGYKWEKREIEDLLRNGYASFLIQPQDLPKARMYLQMSKLPEIDTQQAPKERINSITQVGANFTKALFEGEVTEATVEKAKELGGSLINCLREDNNSIVHISELASHDYYTYHHSIRVASFAVSVAIELGISNEDKLQKIALGAIFHDIGKKHIPVSVLHKSGALTEAEWQQIQTHPKLGVEAVADIKLGHIPVEIIGHHHEKLDGSGYPDKLEGISLLPEVQIATIADIYDALTSTRSYQKKRSSFEALDFMKHKLVGDKLSHEIFSALVSCLSEKDKIKKAS